MAARKAQPLTDGSPLREQDVARHLGQLDGVWDELFPAEQARLLQLLARSSENNPALKVDKKGGRFLTLHSPTANPPTASRHCRHEKLVD